MKKGFKMLFASLAVVLGMGAAGVAGLSTTKVFSKEAESVSADAYSQGYVIEKNKARIWIGYDTGNPFYSYADANTGIRLWIHSTSSGGSENVYGTITGTFNNGAESNRRYDYFDVNLADYTNGWYMTVQKFQNNAWKAQTNSIKLSSANAMQVYWVWGDWAWDKTQGTVAAGSVDSVDAGFAAKALGGILTCSSSNINGYNAFANYNSTFVKNGDDWKTVGNLSDYSLDDYNNGDTSYSGERKNTINAYDKYVFVQSLYATGGQSSSLVNINYLNNDNAILPIIICSALTTVAGVGGYFLLRKKRVHH